VFGRLGIPVEVVDARAAFLQAFKGLTDPEQKRQAIADAFYKQVFMGQAKR